jgi:hypothetical protein
MCELAGVTLAWLSANSSDLHVTKHREALRGAVLLDELSPEQRAAMISLMESMAKPPDPEKG